MGRRRRRGSTVIIPEEEEIQVSPTSPYSIEELMERAAPGEYLPEMDLATPPAPLPGPQDPAAGLSTPPAPQGAQAPPQGSPQSSGMSASDLIRDAAERQRQGTAIAGMTTALMQGVGTATGAGGAGQLPNIMQAQAAAPMREAQGVIAARARELQETQARRAAERSDPTSRLNREFQEQMRPMADRLGLSELVPYITIDDMGDFAGMAHNALRRRQEREGQTLTQLGVAGIESETALELQRMKSETAESVARTRAAASAQGRTRRRGGGGGGRAHAPTSPSGPMEGVPENSLNAMRLRRGLNPRPGGDVDITDETERRRALSQVTQESERQARLAPDFLKLEAAVQRLDELIDIESEDPSQDIPGIGRAETWVGTVAPGLTGLLQGPQARQIRQSLDNINTLWSFAGGGKNLTANEISRISLLTGGGVENILANEQELRGALRQLKSIIATGRDELFGVPPEEYTPGGLGRAGSRQSATASPERNVVRLRDSSGTVREFPPDVAERYIRMGAERVD